MTYENLVPIVCKGEVTQFVERIGGVGNELAKENLRMRIKRVDNKLEKL